MKNLLLCLCVLAITACSGQSGKDGVTGGPGVKGNTGASGQNGSSLITSSGAPSVLLGSDNDSYLDSSSGKLYKKVSGLWTPVATFVTTASAGSAGSPGANGKSLLVDAGVPASSLGQDGDSFLDKNSLNLYLKMSGSWSLISNIKGSAGAAGLNGSSCSVTQTSSGLNLQCTDGTTATASNGMQGAPGAAGARGNDGATGSQGPQGVAGVKGDTGETGAQGQQGVAGLKGDKGDTGEQGQSGAAGARGNSLTVNTTNPTNADGVDGDSWINSTSGDLYKKSLGTWSVAKNIVGARGADGAQGIQGQQGVAGATGAQGIQGVSGVQGPAGQDGAVGAKGDKGDTGEQGIQGLTGSTGSQGLKGDKGDKGDIGNQGIQGVAGPTGNTGAQGIAGAKGEDGSGLLVGTSTPTTATGKDGDSYIDSVSADLWNRVSGAWTKLVNLIGPKGDIGNTGATGTSGANGQNGSQGPQGEKGEVGSPGLTGPAGSSCSAADVSGGVQISCTDGTSALYSGDPTVKPFARTSLPVCSNSQVLSANGTNLSCKVIDPDSSKLSLTGGIMSGEIDMGSQPIKNLATPSAGTDAATKDYVDGKGFATQPTATINVGSSGNTDAQNGTALLNALTNLTNKIPTGDVTIKLAQGVYDIGSTPLTLSNVFASRVSIVGDTAGGLGAQFYTIRTSNSTNIITIASYTNFRLIQGVTLMSTANTIAYGVFVQPMSSVQLINVRIFGGFTIGALYASDQSSVAVNKLYIDGTDYVTQVAKGAGVTCLNQARISFGTNASTIINIGSNVNGIKATLGCTVTATNGAITLNGASTIPATKNVLSSDGAFLTY